MSVTSCAVPYALFSVSFGICSLFFFTIKVLNYLFHVECLHKSFSFSLVSHCYFHTLRSSWVCLWGLNPQTDHIAAFLLPVLPPPSASSDFYCQRLYVSMHPAFTPLKTLWLSDGGIVLILLYCAEISILVTHTQKKWLLLCIHVWLRRQTKIGKSYPALFETYTCIGR